MTEDSQRAAPPSAANSDWDAIHPDRLQESAQHHERAGIYSANDVGVEAIDTRFQLVLGALAGVTMTMFLLVYFRDSLGPLVIFPAAIVGLPVAMLKSIGWKSFGFGMLVSVPISAGIGMAFWYIAQIV